MEWSEFYDWWGENNHTTTTLNFSFNAGGFDTSDNIQIELKSFILTLP